jgi:DNA-binding IclR family transcriptional regulator
MNDRDDDGSTRDSVRAVHLSYDVIEALRDLDGAGVTDLADHLDLAKSTVYRHLTTLDRRGYVVREAGTYRPSLRFVGLGEHAKRNVAIYDVAKAECRRLADETGEIAHFVVEEHGTGVYLRKARGDDAVRATPQTGDRVPLYRTAPGRAILAHLPDGRVDEVLDRGRGDDRVAGDAVDREELFASLDDVRDRGVAADDGDFIPGIRSVAAPVTTPDGHPRGAVSITGPESRLSGDRWDETLPELVRGAANVVEVNANDA